MTYVSRLRAILIIIFVMIGAQSVRVEAVTTGGGDNAVSTRSNTSQSRDRPDSGHSDWAIAELVRIDQRIRAIDRQISQASSSATSRAAIDSASRTLAELKRSPGRACNAPPEARAELIRQLAQTIDTLGGISGGLPSIYPWEELTTEQVEQLCDQPLLAAIGRMEAGIANMSRELAAATDSIDDLEREKAEQETRKQNVVTRMSNEVAAARVAGIMPWILVIVFTMGVVMLLGARLFSPAIQSELVCSGQLVQFATILILFGALIALGLADKLQEQTLAALLGGLAGYVLSQGIGQKDQRSTLQTIRTMARESGQPGGGRADQLGRNQPGQDSATDEHAPGQRAPDPEGQPNDAQPAESPPASGPGGAGPPEEPGTGRNG